MPRPVLPPAFPPIEAAPHRLVFTAFGVTLGVRSHDEALLERAREALPPSAVPSSAVVEEWFTLQRSLPSRVGAPRHRLLRQSAIIAEGIRLGPVLEALEDALRLAVASRTSTHVFVHAGVVRAGSGTIVLPGRSASGKTTLVRALVDAGAEYWSDEYAVFDAAGQVWPYPRRISVRQGTHRRHREALVGPPADEPAPMRLLIATAYEPGGVWAPRPLSPGDAVMALFSHTLTARSKPAFALAALAEATKGSFALAGGRGDATTCVLAILQSSAGIGDPFTRIRTEL